MKIKNVVGHFRTVCIHRFWVCYYCFKCGLYWQGLTHDLSKFSPTEFVESVKYYTGTSSPIDLCKKENGYSIAWLHHKGVNKHHYEYWQDNFDKGTTHLPMPYKYVLEMICDFLGAGRAYYGKSFTLEKEYEWWENNKDKKSAMNQYTKQIVEYYMQRFSIDKSIVSLTDKDLRLSIKENYISMLGWENSLL